VKLKLLIATEEVAEDVAEETPCSRKVAEVVEKVPAVEAKKKSFVVGRNTNG
jgi:hypothetical protein